MKERKSLALEGVGATVFIDDILSVAVIHEAFGSVAVLYFKTGEASLLVPKLGNNFGALKIAFGNEAFIYSVATDSTAITQVTTNTFVDGEVDILDVYLGKDTKGDEVAYVLVEKENNNREKNRSLRVVDTRRVNRHRETNLNFLKGRAFAISKVNGDGKVEDMTPPREKKSSDPAPK